MANGAHLSSASVIFFNSNNYKPIETALPFNNIVAQFSCPYRMCTSLPLFVVAAAAAAAAVRNLFIIVVRLYVKGDRQYFIHFGSMPNI